MSTLFGAKAAAKLGAKAYSHSLASPTRTLGAGLILAAVALGSLLCGSQPALAQATDYYKVDLAAALTKASSGEWLRRRDAARQAQPDFAVETLDDFIKMNEYYDKFISDGVAVHSFKTTRGDEIRCIDVATQQSVLAAGLDRASIPLHATVEPREQSPAAGQQRSRSEGAKQGLDGSLDDLGRERACAEGTFPKLIFPKESLYRLKKFEDIFRKYPSGKSGGLMPAPSGPPHEYAKASNYSVDNKGLQAEFNVWSPTLGASDEMSLSQLWVVGGSGSGLQTAETGWQVQPNLFGDNLPRLFVYGTSDGYSGNNAASGCYNLQCGRFVQTNNSIVLGGALTSSTTGGPQYIYKLTFFRDDAGTHSWWLYVNDTAVGYYPTTLYNSAGIADKNSRLDFGGEIVNDQTGGVNTQTDMGSGAFPSAGFGQAAFIRKIQYIDMSFQWQNASDLSQVASIPYLWDATQAIYSTDPNWLTYFYFGGPGNRNYTVSVSASAGGTVSGGGTYAAGATPTVTATPSSGYLFVNWTEGGTQVSTSASYILPQLIADHTLVANFSPVDPAVVTSPTPGSTLPGSSVTFGWSSGTGVTDYYFSVGTTLGANNLYGADQFTNRSVTVNNLPTIGQTVYVRLYSLINGLYYINDYTYTEPVQYTVTVNASPPAGGQVAGGGTFAGGSSRNVLATPNGSYIFVNWTENGTQVSTSASYDFTLNGNRNLVANFVQTFSITVSASPPAGGQVAGGGIFAGGSSRNVLATPNGGYSFVNWTESGTQVSTSASYDFTLTGNRTLVANFVQNYSITVSASPPAGGQVAGGGSYASGSSRNVLATPNGGYSFVNWTEGGSAVSALASYTFTLTANRTLVANFKAATTTSVSNVPNPTVFGQPVTFTATVASGAGTPTGTVTFTIDSVAQSPITLASGHASLTTSTLAHGSHSVTAAYNGDSNFMTSSSSTATQTVNQGSTTGSVGSSANPSKAGQTVTFSVTVAATAPAAGLPTGTATINFGDSTSAQATLVNGIASINHIFPQIGTYNVSASYGGDSNFNSSTATGVSQLVQQGATTTSVSPSASPSKFGQTVTFTAHVVATSPASGTPTGTATFNDGGSALGTISVSGGTATFFTSSLSVGGHTITAVYNGDINFTASTSPGVTQTVNQGVTTTSLGAAPNPSKVGQSVTFTATVAATSPASGTPTGTVTFKDGGGTIGTGTLSASTAAFTTSSLTLGTHTITAVYGGSTNFASSTSTATQTVNPATSSQTVAHDFNGDGKSDILLRDTNTGAVKLWLMNGGAVFPGGTIAGIATNWQIVAQRDFNGDGKADILWRDNTTGTVRLFLMNGLTVTQNLLVASNVPSHFVIAGVGDFNGDGKADILWRDMSTGAVSMWFMNGATVLNTGIVGTVTLTWSIIGTSPNGHILWRNNSTGALTEWVMNGAAVSQTHNLGTVNAPWAVVGSGDFDGNGSLDLLLRNGSTGEVKIWFTTNGVVSSVASLGIVPTAYSADLTGDFNGDGKSDIVWTNTSTGARSIWFMNGGVLASSTNLGTVATTLQIQSKNAE
jgi:hypothetical protein